MEEEDILNLFGDEVEEVFAPEDMVSDTLEPLIVREKQLYMATQAVALLEQPSSGSANPSLPPRSWAQEMEDEEAASLEGVQQGPGDQGLHHSSGVSLEDTSMGGVELVTHQPKPQEQEDLAREARRKASYLAAQRCFSGRGSGLQIPDNTLELESVTTLQG